MSLNHPLENKNFLVNLIHNQNSSIAHQQDAVRNGRRTIDLCKNSLQNFGPNYIKCYLHLQGEEFYSICFCKFDKSICDRQVR